MSVPPVPCGDAMTGGTMPHAAQRRQVFAARRPRAPCYGSVAQAAGSSGPLTPAVSRAVDRAAAKRSTGPLLLNRREGGWTDAPPAAASVTWRPSPRPQTRMHPHMLRHTSSPTLLDRSRPARRADRRPARRPTDHHALRPRPQDLDRHPNPHPRGVHGVRHLTASRR
jgi:hypothetical protein